MRAPTYLPPNSWLEESILVRELFHDRSVYTTFVCVLLDSRFPCFVTVLGVYVRRLRWRYGDGQDGWHFKLSMNTPRKKYFRYGAIRSHRPDAP